MHLRRFLACTAICAVAFNAIVPSAFAETGYQKQQKKEAQLPHCTHSFGTLAIHEPENRWWQDMGVGSPVALLKVYVNESHCFKLVDRGAGLQDALQERQLGTNLRRGSNYGRGQITQADYFLVPDLVTHNQNAGGSGIAGLLGALLPGTAGALVGGLKFTNRTATVTLTLSDGRTTEQKAFAEGRGKKTDVGWAAGGADIGSSGMGAIGATGYTNTEEGQILVLAYLDAYAKLVDELGGPGSPAPLPEEASAAAPAAAIQTVRIGHLYALPSAKSKPIRMLPIGTILYPTSTPKHGVWAEVQDEGGTTGWVSTVLTEQTTQ